MRRRRHSSLNIVTNSYLGQTEHYYLGLIALASHRDANVNEDVFRGWPESTPEEMSWKLVFVRKDGKSYSGMSVAA